MSFPSIDQRIIREFGAPPVTNIPDFVGWNSIHDNDFE